MFLQYFSVIQKCQLKDESDAERVRLFLVRVRLKDFLCVSVCVGDGRVCLCTPAIQNLTHTHTHRASEGLFNRLTLL